MEGNNLHHHESPIMAWWDDEMHFIVGYIWQRIWGNQLEFMKIDKLCKNAYKSACRPLSTVRFQNFQIFLLCSS
jgi:hypothetical protein